MDNKDLVLLTGIRLKINQYRKLKKEINEAPPEKGMEQSKKELKILQKTVIKEINILDKRLKKKEKSGEVIPLLVWPSSIFKEIK